MAIHHSSKGMVKQNWSHSQSTLLKMRSDINGFVENDADREGSDAITPQRPLEVALRLKPQLQLLLYRPA